MSQTSSNKKPVLFYSKRCPHCAEVMKKIGSDASDFELLCIDGVARLPPYLKEVPTLIAPTHPNPLTGEAVFMWIDSFIRANARNRTSNVQQHANPTQTQAQGSIATNMEGLAFYSPSEMGGFGDSFSFLDGSSPVEHCFMFLDENGQKQVKCVPQQAPPQQAPQQASTPGVQVPDWLKPQNVGKTHQPEQQYQKQTQSAYQMTGYNANVIPGLTAAQQNNISMQNSARRLPNFNDPQRQPIVGGGSGNKLTDSEYEQFINSRNSDSRIQSAPQRM
jgi:hypothetical protein